MPIQWLWAGSKKILRYYIYKYYAHKRHYNYDGAYFSRKYPFGNNDYLLISLRMILHKYQTLLHLLFWHRHSFDWTLTKSPSRTVPQYQYLSQSFSRR